MPAAYKFSSLPNINIPRTAMKVECTHPTSFLHGKIIPLFCIPCGPGENYKLYLNSLIRMQNPIFPFYGDIKVFVHSFFVPMRLLWDHTAQFFGENVLTKGPQPIEYTIPAADYGASVTSSTNVWDYVGLNQGAITGVTNTAGSGINAPWINSVSHYLGKPLPSQNYAQNYANSNIKVSVLKERGFWSIFNEYYRPQQLMDPIFIHKTDTGVIGFDPNRKVGGNATNLTFATEVPSCTKMYDYFRSATVSPIYSDSPVTIPVEFTGAAPLVNDSDDPYLVSELNPENGDNFIRFGLDPTFATGHSFTNTNKLLGSNITTAGEGSLGIYNASESVNTFMGKFLSNSGSGDSQPFLETTLKTDLSAITAIAGSVDQLRYLFAQYNFLYRDNFGTRYPEIIQTHFNLKPSIAILQRPELLHEGSFPINVSQVLSTAGATDDATTKLGQPGANSVTANRQLVVNKSIEEWGFIYIMLETKHKRVYSSGINAYDLRRTKYDFYFPEFAMIGNKKIMTTELSVDIPVAHSEAYTEAFGYQEAWAEERYFVNHVSGLLDPRAPSSYSYMTLAEDIDPNNNVINLDFVTEDREAIANVLVSGENGPDYTGDFALTGVMAKPMPLYSEPGLIDHIGAW